MGRKVNTVLIGGGLFIVLLINLNFINPTPNYGQYSFEIYGDFDKEDKLNSMTFHYDFEKGEGFISFSFESFNKNFRRISFLLPPNTKYKNISVSNGNVDVIPYAPNIFQQYVIRFLEPVNDSSIKFDFGGNITPNGVFVFNTQPAYGWNIRLFLNQFKCISNCITHSSEDMGFFVENKPHGTEILIRKERDAGEYPIHHIKFNIQSYDSNKELVRQVLLVVSTGLIVAGITNSFIPSNKKQKIAEEFSK